MKKKLKLNELKINSFITEDSSSKKLGGATEACSFDACPTVPINNCNIPSYNACPTIPLENCVHPPADTKICATGSICPTYRCYPIITQIDCFK